MFIRVTLEYLKKKTPMKSIWNLSEAIQYYNIIQYSILKSFLYNKDY